MVISAECNIQVVVLGQHVRSASFVQIDTHRWSLSDTLTTNTVIIRCCRVSGVPISRGFTRCRFDDQPKGRENLGPVAILIAVSNSQMQRRSHNKSAMRRRTCFQHVGDRFGPTAKKQSVKNLVERNKQGVISGSHRASELMRIHEIERESQGG